MKNDSSLSYSRWKFILRWATRNLQQYSIELKFQPYFNYHWFYPNSTIFRISLTNTLCIGFSPNDWSDICFCTNRAPVGVSCCRTVGDTQWIPGRRQDTTTGAAWISLKHWCVIRRGLVDGTAANMAAQKIEMPALILKAPLSLHSGVKTSFSGSAIERWRQQPRTARYHRAVRPATGDWSAAGGKMPAIW